MHTTFVQYTHEQHSILNLFLPSAIREWNTLPLNVRNCDSIISFKRKLNSDINAVPKYFTFVTEKPRYFKSEFVPNRAL